MIFTQCINGLKEINKLRACRILRPSHPILGNSKIWWKYALKCFGVRYESPIEKLEKAKNNIRYVQIYGKFLVSPTDDNLSLEEKQFKLYIEQTRSLNDLRFLREICFLKLSSPSLNIKNPNDKHKNCMLFQWFPYWRGWYGYSSNIKLQQEVPCVESVQTLEYEILRNFDNASDTNSIFKKDCLLVNLQFALKRGKLLICTEQFITLEKNAIVELNFDNISLKTEVRSQLDSHLIEFLLGSISIKDFVTLNTKFPFLITPQLKSFDGEVSKSYKFKCKHKQELKESNKLPFSISNHEPLFHLQFEKRPLYYNTDFRLAIKSKQLVVINNSTAFNCLFDFFKMPFQKLNTKSYINAKSDHELLFTKKWKNIINEYVVNFSS